MTLSQELEKYLLNAGFEQAAEDGKLKCFRRKIIEIQIDSFDRDDLVSVNCIAIRNNTGFIILGNCWCRNNIYDDGEIIDKISSIFKENGVIVKDFNDLS